MNPRVTDNDHDEIIVTLRGARTSRLELRR